MNIMINKNEIKNVFVLTQCFEFNKNETQSLIHDYETIFNEFYNSYENILQFENENELYSFFAMLYLCNIHENEIKIDFHLINYFAIKIANNEHDVNECIKRLYKLHNDMLFCDDFEMLIDENKHKTIF